MRTTSKTLGAIGAIVNGANLRAVLCDYCDGLGYLHDVAGFPWPVTTLAKPHQKNGPSIQPCFDCRPCPECGQNGCGPGVRWAEVTP